VLVTDGVITLILNVTIKLQAVALKAFLNSGYRLRDRSGGVNIIDSQVPEPILSTRMKETAYSG
jgi:hypothetical protein